METQKLCSYYEGYDEYCDVEDEYQFKLESKILLYENFTKIIKDILEESEDGTVKVEDIKLQLNDLAVELRSV